MSAAGALIGLALAIFLIIRKVSPVYSLMAGALAGGLAGGMNLPDTVGTMITGVQDVVPAIVRVLAAGVLSGALVVSGAAEKISDTIIRKLGAGRVFLALALATMLLTAVGVFIDVAVITIAPIALNLARHLSIPRSSLLVMMIGGGKCGNIISPNPNTIIAAENFHADLYNVMYANLIPSIVGLLFTVYVIGRFLPRLEEQSVSAVSEESCSVTGDFSYNERGGSKGPSFFAAVSGPLVSIALLALRPVAGISVDPMIALPAGGLAGLLCMGCIRLTGKSLSYGLGKMTSVAALLIGTGTIAGIIKASTLKDLILGALSSTGLGDALIAPVSGALMSAATASTTAGATVASSSFADVILAAGISGVWGAAMVNSGATVFDHFPHGSFFHATGGVTELSFSKRLRLVPYESLIGFVLASMTVLVYLI